MGSWNENCAVSGLNINYGDKVVLIPYINGEANCPCMLPIRGIYNSYGTIKHVQYTPALHMLEKLLISKSFVFDEDSTPLPPGVGIWLGSEYVERCNSSVIPDNLMKFCDAIERQMCLGVYGDNVIKVAMKSKWHALGFVLVHEEVYDWLVSNSDEIVNEHGRATDLSTLNIDDLPEIFDVKEHNIFKILYDVSSHITNSDVRSVINTYTPRIPSCKTKTELISLYDTSVEYYKFRIMFDYLGKVYAPSLMRGCQNDNTNQVKKLNSMVNKFTAQLKKSRQ